MSYLHTQIHETNKKKNFQVGRCPGLLSYYICSKMWHFRRYVSFFELLLDITHPTQRRWVKMWAMKRASSWLNISFHHRLLQRSHKLVRKPFSHQSFRIFWFFSFTILGCTKRTSSIICSRGRPDYNRQSLSYCLSHCRFERPQKYILTLSVVHLRCEIMEKYIPYQHPKTFLAVKNLEVGVIKHDIFDTIPCSAVIYILSLATLHVARSFLCAQHATSHWDSAGISVLEQHPF